MKKAILKDKRTDQFKNLLVYAISSVESDLRICMVLNQTLNINLTLSEDCEVISKKDKAYFRRYYHESDEGIERINLFINRNSNNFLIPELKKIDFLLAIQTEAPTSGLEIALQNLKKSPEITVISKIDPSSLRSISRIIIQ